MFSALTSTGSHLSKFCGGIVPMVRVFSNNNPTVTGTYTTSTYTDGNGYSYKLYKFTTNGTFIPTQDCTLGYVVIGGSGGGGGGTTSSAGMGSGANGSNIVYSSVSENLTTFVASGSTLTITLGSQGKNYSGNGGNINGSDGGNSSIAGSWYNTITASGGKGGVGDMYQTGPLNTPTNATDTNPSPAHNLIGAAGGIGGNSTSQNTNGTAATGFTVDFISGTNYWNSGGGGSYYNGGNGNAGSYTSPYYGAKAANTGAGTINTPAGCYGCGAGGGGAAQSGPGGNGIQGYVIVAYRYA